MPWASTLRTAPVNWKSTPLTTPIGGGIRSLNVALRQIFDLYCCVRPCRYYEGTPSPHKRPQLSALKVAPSRIQNRQHAGRLRRGKNGALNNSCLKISVRE